MSDIAPQPFVNYGLSQAQQGQAQAQQVQAQASANLMNQQATGAAIQNSVAALAYQVRRNAVMSMFSQPGGNGSLQLNGAGAGAGAGGSDYNNASDQSGADFDYGNSVANPGSLEQTMRQRYFINPAGTPQEQQNIALAALSGDEGLKQAAIYQRDMNVNSRQYMASQDARNHFDTMNAVVNADPDQTWSIFAKVAPAAASQILNANPQDPNESDDEYAVRMGSIAHDTAAHYAAAVHQYTGRELVKGDDGVYRDKDTGLAVPVPATGMSKEQYDTAWSKANALVPVQLSDGSDVQKHQYEIDGFKTAASDIEAQWRQQQALATMPSHPAFAGTPMQQPGTTQTLTDAQNALAYHGVTPTVIAQARNQVPGQAPQGQPGPGQAPQGQPGPGQAPQVQPGPGQAPQVQPGPGQPTTRPPPGDPAVLKQALSDPEYRLPTSPVVVGRSQSPVNASQAIKINDARNSLLSDTSDDARVAGQALRYYAQAQQIVTSGGVTTGLGAGQITEINMALQQMGLPPLGNDPSKNIELAKNLTQATLANLKNTFGPRIAQSEVFLSLEKANPSANMPPEALKNLINEQVANLNYTVNTARRARLYVQNGGDPRSFGEWNQGYFPRQNAPSPNQPTPSPATTNTPVRVKSPQQAASLPSGTTFITPDGRTMVKR